MHHGTGKIGWIEAERRAPPKQIRQVVGAHLLILARCSRLARVGSDVVVTLRKRLVLSLLALLMSSVRSSLLRSSGARFADARSMRDGLVAARLPN
jgi:hypothetical protein